MTTEKQKTANQQNAKRSTGPRTANGKAITCRNATKHGLLSEAALLADEDADHLAELRAQLLEELRPEGVVETMLADLIAATVWRLRRVLVVETGLMFHSVPIMEEPPPSDYGLPPEITGRKLEVLGHERVDIGDLFHDRSEAFDRLNRYGTSIQNGLLKLLDRYASIKKDGRANGFVSPNRAGNTCLGRCTGHSPEPAAGDGAGQTG